jgi:hypothetical protein
MATNVKDLNAYEFFSVASYSQREGSGLVQAFVESVVSVDNC